jgi:hypothetical protein
VGLKPDLTACNASQISTESKVSIMTHQNEDPSVDRKKTHIEILKTHHELSIITVITVLLMSRLFYAAREVNILMFAWFAGVIINLVFIKQYRSQIAPLRNRLYGYTVGTALFLFGTALGAFSYSILYQVFAALPHLRGTTLIVGLLGLICTMKGVEMMLTKYTDTSSASQR